MKITAVYYVIDSDPYNQYVITVCDANDIGRGNASRAKLWRLFEKAVKKQGYPMPDSDVVFLYTKPYFSATIAAQMTSKEDY